MGIKGRPLKELLANFFLISYIILGWTSYHFLYIEPEYPKDRGYYLFILISFNAIFGMCMASLYKLQTTPAGSPPPDYRPKPVKPSVPESPPSESNQRTGVISLTVLYERYCTHCRIPKPERTHHCRRCGKCTLKMDHHCPYTNTCIGFYNYKYYVLLLMYGALEIFFVVVTQFYFVWNIWDQTNKGFTEWATLFMFCGHVLWLLNVGMLVLFHLHAVIENATTIEMHEHDQKNYKSKVYNINPADNWMSVFGLSPLYWFLPVDWGRVGDGLTFPVNDELFRHYSRRPDALLV